MFVCLSAFVCVDMFLHTQELHLCVCVVALGGNKVTKSVGFGVTQRVIHFLLARSQSPQKQGTDSSSSHEAASFR